MGLNTIKEDYFEWMCSLVCDTRRKRERYGGLLRLLHNIEFTYSIPMDENRASDGEGLRLRFSRIQDYDDVPACLYGPCSVLEMMVALAVRCEEQIMDDPDAGNRTSEWFFEMIHNLGLSSMTNDSFDRYFVYNNIDRFLNREYQPDGSGGLFTIKNCKYDLRDVEIWYQMCWYLDSIL